MNHIRSDRVHNNLLPSRHKGIKLSKLLFITAAVASQFWAASLFYRPNGLGAEPTDTCMCQVQVHFIFYPLLQLCRISDMSHRSRSLSKYKIMTQYLTWRWSWSSSSLGCANTVYGDPINWNFVFSRKTRPCARDYRFPSEIMNDARAVYMMCLNQTHEINRKIRHNSFYFYDSVKSEERKKCR